MGSHVVTRGQMAATGHGVSAHHEGGGRGHTHRHTPNKPETPAPQNLRGQNLQDKTKPTKEDPHDKPTRQPAFQSMDMIVVTLVLKD